MQILYDNGVFDNFANDDEILKDFLFTTRLRPDLLEQVNDDIQVFFKKIKFKK